VLIARPDVNHDEILRSDLSEFEEIFFTLFHDASVLGPSIQKLWDVLIMIRGVHQSLKTISPFVRFQANADLSNRRRSIVHPNGVRFSASPGNLSIKRHRFQMNSVPSLEQRRRKSWAFLTVDDLIVQIPVIPNLDGVIVRIMCVDLRDEICLSIERGWSQDNGVNDGRLISFWRFTGA
jgi:hypothetical protein